VPADLTVVHAERDAITSHSYAAGLVAEHGGRLIVVPAATHSCPYRDVDRFGDQFGGRAVLDLLPSRTRPSIGVTSTGYAAAERSLKTARRTGARARLVAVDTRDAPTTSVPSVDPDPNSPGCPKRAGLGPPCGSTPPWTP
jgi:hypothetical protein